MGEHNINDKLNNVAAVVLWSTHAYYDKEKREWQAGWYFKDVYKTLGTARGIITRETRHGKSPKKWQILQVSTTGWQVVESSDDA